MLNTPQACPGYTLFAPKHHTMTYLMDNQGRAVHRWDSQYEPGQSVYLLENGHLLHCCFTRNKGFTRGGEGGRLEEFDWDGNLVWEFEYSSDQYLSHHDVKPLPNGNILVLAVEKKSLRANAWPPALIRKCCATNSCSRNTSSKSSRLGPRAARSSGNGTCGTT